MQTPMHAKEFCSQDFGIAYARTIDIDTACSLLLNVHTPFD